MEFKIDDIIKNRGLDCLHNYNGESFIIGNIIFSHYIVDKKIAFINITYADLNSEGILGGMLVIKYHNNMPIHDIEAKLDGALEYNAGLNALEKPNMRDFQNTMRKVANDKITKITRLMPLVEKSVSKSLPDEPSVMTQIVDDGINFMYSFSNLITKEGCERLIEFSDKLMVPSPKWAYNEFPGDLVSIAPLGSKLDIGRLQGMRDIAGIDDDSIRVVRQQAIVGVPTSLDRHTTDVNTVSIIVCLNDGYSNGTIVSKNFNTVPPRRLNTVPPMTVGSAIMYSHSEDIIIHPVTSLVTAKYIIRMDIARTSALEIISKFITKYGSLINTPVCESEEEVVQSLDFQNYMKNIIDIEEEA